MFSRREEENLLDLDITNSDRCEKVPFWEAQLEQLLWLTSSWTFWKAQLELITVNNNMAKEKISAAESGKIGRESEARFCQWCQLYQNCIRTRRRSFHPRTTKEAHVPVSIGEPPEWEMADNLFRDITNSDRCEKVPFWQARLEQLL